MSKKKADPTIVPMLTILNAAYTEAVKLFPEKAQREALSRQRPLIVIQHGGRRKKRLYGWHANRRWKRGKDEIDEITLTAEALSQGYYDAMDTLVHEMVHHANHLLGVEDCTANGYHNRKFAVLAEAVGLTVKKMGRHGFAQTVVSPEFKATVDGWGFDKKAFDMYRTKEPGIGKGSKLKKWSCKCGYGIRIAVTQRHEVDLTCGVCGSKVTKKE